MSLSPTRPKKALYFRVAPETGRPEYAVARLAIGQHCFCELERIVKSLRESALTLADRICAFDSASRSLGLCKPRFQVPNLGKHHLLRGIRLQSSWSYPASNSLLSWNLLSWILLSWHLLSTEPAVGIHLDSISWELALRLPHGILFSYILLCGHSEAVSSPYRLHSYQ